MDLEQRALLPLPIQQCHQTAVARHNVEDAVLERKLLNRGAAQIDAEMRCNLAGAPAGKVHHVLGVVDTERMHAALTGIFPQRNAWAAADVQNSVTIADELQAVRDLQVA